MRSLRRRIARLEASVAFMELGPMVIAYGDRDVETELQRLYGDGPRPGNPFVVRVTGPARRS